MILNIKYVKLLMIYGMINLIINNFLIEYLFISK
jgi:hypothetical protein